MPQYLKLVLLLMWGYMRYHSLYTLLPAVDDCQLSRCVEKQGIVLLNVGTDSKMYFSHLKEGTSKKRYVCSTLPPCTRCLNVYN